MVGPTTVVRLGALNRSFQLFDRSGEAGPLRAVERLLIGLAGSGLLGAISGLGDCVLRAGRRVQLFDQAGT